MTSSTRPRSARSGRRTGVADVDSGWLDPALAELKNVRAKVVELGEHHANEADFAVLWAANWLLGYAAGWCTLHETLDATRRAATRLPPPTPRLLLGVVAHKAMLATPRRLGEHKAKTPPHLVQCLGPLVQSKLFDDKGVQLCTVEEAVDRARAELAERDLMPQPPSAESLGQWFAEWRRGQESTGNEVPRPARGRPSRRK